MSGSEHQEGRAGDGGDGAGLTIPQALEFARGLHKSGVLEAAEEIYERILLAAPDQVDALHFLGLARYQRGLHREGIDQLGRALAVAPEHVDARNNLGNMLLEQGRLAEAEQAYQEVLRRRPEHADAHVNLGNVLRRRQDTVGAEAAYRRALEIDRNHGDAHHNLGSVLRDAGRTDEALTAFQRALSLRPYDGESYRRVGAMLYALGRVADASAVYQSWVEVEPGNPVAQHLVAACSGRDAPSRASDAFVQKTFDSFAESFDAVLERLEYRAPALVAKAVASVVGLPAGGLDVLDAGVGTGLCGPSLRPYARRLVGIDLSPRMLAKAKERGSYDELETAELTAYMRERPGTFDLVVSADTLVYLGDLEPAFAAAAGALRAGGHLVFTLEREKEAPPEGFRLNPHGRYGHGEAYVRRTLAAAGFNVLDVEPVQLRLENRRPVEGLLIGARKSH
ncbi:MAG: tetratricopeptide repeat protein [Myxococcales bacterium]